MRLYGRKFVNKSLQKKVRDRIETRDAVLWDIDTESKTCRCKIQGSSEFVIAHYPRNLRVTPLWLKPGNAVRILHRSGVKGFIEVIGEGRAIPTPVTGDTSGTLPDMAAQPDGILSGLTISAMATPTMSVLIASGTYMIDEVTYAYTSPASSGSYVTMTDPPTMMMGSNPYDLGATYQAFTLDAAPSVGTYRYDAFYIGTDGVIDYVTGDVSATPQYPTTPGNHVLVGDYILVAGGATAITNGSIGKIWTDEEEAYILAEIDSTDVIEYEWAWEGTAGTQYAYETIKVKLQDQYGNFYDDLTYPLATEVKAGTGMKISDALGGTYGDSVSGTINNGYDYVYLRRDQQNASSVNPCVLSFVVSRSVEDMPLRWVLIVMAQAYTAP